MKENPLIVVARNCPGWGGIFLGRSCLRGNCPRWDLSGGNCPESNYPGGNHPGGLSYNLSENDVVRKLSVPILTIRRLSKTKLYSELYINF